jgi:glycosyltransferase involved in cell wall biosynthesis
MSIDHIPIVSIGLPVFNGANYLCETLDSILAQTFEDFELIVCDNASEDETEAICRSYAARDARIRYHRQPKNLGAQVNYDMSFELARGRYFKWASHDDLLGPEFLAECVAVLESDPGCVLVHPATTIIDQYGASTQCYIDLIDSDSEDPIKRLARWLDPPEGYCNPVFGLMRPDVMAKTGLHGDFASSDRAFLAEMTLHGRCRMIRKGLFFRRIHPLNSVVAHPDPRDLVAWFKGNRPKLTFIQNRLLWGFVQVLFRAPLNGTERLRGVGIVLKWAVAMRKSIVKEWLLPFYMNGQATVLTRSIQNLFKRYWPKS